jgi:hypothetical protein
MNLWYEYKRWKEPPADADKQWYRDRGYALERILNSLLDREELHPRLSYKIDGEQIDGSFSAGLQFFLIEAKWHAKPLAASVIYGFYGKVDGKLDGTLGVFVSMSGFSDDAPDALVKGKRLLVVLFDQDDIEASLSPSHGFKLVLHTKLRAAAEEGVVFFPYRSAIVQKHRKEPHVTLEETLDQRASGRTLVAVCEGVLDSEIIRALAVRLAKDRRLAVNVKTVLAHGKILAPRMANLVFDATDRDAQLVILVDSDGRPQDTRAFLEKETKVPGVLFSIPDPGVEAWLGLTDSQFRSRIDREQRRGIGPDEVIQHLISGLDLEQLRHADASFAVLYDALVR